MTFYEKFIELCVNKGEKPTPVVINLGLSSSNVSMWKKGSTPRPAIVKKIADYFGVTTDYLLSEEQKEKPPAEPEAADPNKAGLIALTDKMSRAELILMLERAPISKTAREALEASAKRIIESRG